MNRQWLLQLALLVVMSTRTETVNSEHYHSRDHSSKRLHCDTAYRSTEKLNGPPPKRTPDRMRD